MKKVFLKSLLLALAIGSLVYFYYSLPDVSLLAEAKPARLSAHGTT